MTAISDATQAKSGVRPLRMRAVVLGTLLAMVVCALTPYNNIYLRATPLGGGHFPLAPFFIFLLLAVTISGFNRIFKRASFLTGGELLIVWIQMVIGSGIAYTGFARTFLINLTAPVQFASAGNLWQETLHPLIPSGLIPTDTSAIETLYNGLPGGREMSWLGVVTNIPWQAWLLPLLLWGAFIVLCYLVMVFLINLLSRQWIHNERMNFPLLKVPELVAASMSEHRLGEFFSDKYLLAGLVLPVFLHLLNGLNIYYPSVPAIPTLFLAGPYFNESGLLAGFHKLKLYIFPAFIGFAFLTSRQISLSFWFFFIVGSLLYGILNMLGYSIPTSELGVTFGPTLAQPEEMQMLGAYLVFFLFLVWLARVHLKEVVKESLFLAPAAPHRSEWFDVRISFWGAWAGIGMIVWWYVFLGMRPLVAIPLVCAFFMVMLVATRIICQGGLAYFTLTAAPTDGLIALFGSKFFAGASSLLAGMSQKVLFVDLRESLMPSLLHGRHLHQGRRPALLLFAGMLLTILLSLTSSVVAMMALCYKFGIRELQLDWATTTSVTVFENIYRLVAVDTASGDWVYIFSILGALVMLILVICYHRFFWWPIHPIGYLTAYSSAMRIMWLSFFIGWTCNALCMRYGGVHLFRRLQMFFVGMIIGDFLMGGGWALVGLFTGMSYQVLPD